MEENSEVKEAAVKYNYYTIDDYLAIERESRDTKYELHEGKLITMQGASDNHAFIVANIMVEVGSYLKNKDCRIVCNDLKVAIKAKDSVFYPDIVILCGDAEVYDEHKDVLLNPVAIIEVLSPSTQKYDLGDKFYYYRQIETICQYVVIGSTSHYIYNSFKRPDGKWLVEETSDIAGSLTIEPINFTLPLTEIYRNVSF